MDQLLCVSFEKAFASAEEYPGQFAITVNFGGQTDQNEKCSMSFCAAVCFHVHGPFAEQCSAVQSSFTFYAEGLFPCCDSGPGNLQNGDHVRPGGAGPARQSHWQG